MMNDQKSQSNSQGRCEFLDEDTLITGGKTVSEIIQMLRTNAKFKKIVKGCDDNEDKEEQSRKISFPWIVQFGTSCKEVISNPTIVKLDILMSNFLKNLEKDVKQCSKKPKRAYRLRIRINPFLILFHMIYWDIKKPLEHTSYLDKMSDIMALYIDVELKSSRIARENPKKISQRICTSLYVLLDKSTDHILDSVLKATFFNKSYSEICVPVMARLLKENPGKMYEATYVRYLLAFKLWKKLAGKDQYATINKEAIAMLKPPPNFAERLKSGQFANVLPFPYVSKKESLTYFFMRSPFNVKEKAQLFLKDWRKLQPSGDIDKSFLFDEDFKMANLFDKESQRDESDDLINDIWKSLVEKEMDPLDELIEIESTDEDDNILIDIKKNKSKEKIKKANDKSSSCSISKIPPAKKPKLSKNNLCIPVKNVSNKDSVGIVKTESKLLVVSNLLSSKEDNTLISSNTENSLKKDEKNNVSLINNNVEVQVQKKPCATVEPEQCKEVEPDSQSITEGLIQSSSQHITVTDTKIKDNTESPANYEIVITPKISETVIEESLPEVVDSTGICEEIKPDTNINTQAIFDVEEMYKDKSYEQTLLEVGEEVVIDTEISQDEGDTTLLIMDGDQDILNVIGIPKHATPYCSDSEANDSEYWKKNQDLTDSSSLKNRCNLLNSQSKLNFVKDQASTPTNNEHQLSLYENSSSCLIDQRPDHYVYNEMKLTRLLSAEINGDEGSDDDNRCTNNMFATGGKFPAFRGRITDESKSEEGEESEVSSPVSQTDSNTVETSPESVTAQSGQNSLINSNNLDNVQETKFELKSNRLPATLISRTPIDPSQLPEVSVSLAYMTDLGNLNDYHSNKEKNNSKGMCEPPDSILHFKTVDDDIKFYVLQQQLYTLYNTTENIIETEPVPYPPTVIVPSPINGYVRCPCSFCHNQFVNLVRNYKFLFDMRNFLVCQEVDKTRMLSKFYLKIEQRKIEDDKLLKSIEETIPVVKGHQNASPKEVNPESKSECNSSINLLKSDQPISRIEDTKDSKNEIESLGNQPEENLGDKRDSNLPPKKRKAFSLNAKLMTEKESELENEKKFKDKDLNDKNTCSLKMRCDPINVPLPNSNAAIEQTRPPQACDIANHEASVEPPLVEKLEKAQCVISNDIPLKDGKSRHEQCRISKRYKKYKEEKRQRKERRRLKRQRREEEKNKLESLF